MEQKFPDRQSDKKPQPAPIIRPGFRFHLSTLMWCAVAMGFLMWAATSHAEASVAQALRTIDTSRMTAGQAEQVVSSLKFGIRLSIFINYLQFTPLLLGCVVAFSELWIRGRDARYAKEAKDGI